MTTWAGTFTGNRPLWDVTEEFRVRGCGICGGRHSADECPETVGQRLRPIATPFTDAIPRDPVEPGEGVFVLSGSQRSVPVSASFARRLTEVPAT
jgi:hypothetical protein